MENLPDFKKVLIFSGHPDDVDFGCAGATAKMTGEGKEVVYCIITNGEKGIRNVKVSNGDVVSIREKEQKAAAQAAGVSRAIFLDETDGVLENTPEVRKKIVRTIRQERPDIVISFDPANSSFSNFYRFHRDHRMAGEAVFDAVYPAAGSEAFFPELMAEGFMPHQIKGMLFFGSSNPDFFVDITETIARKIDALKCHVSQIKDTKEMEKRIRERARDEGKKIGVEYAEGFRKLMF